MKGHGRAYGDNCHPHHRTVAFLHRNCLRIKVLSFLEACFDMIPGSSLHMKIQIMGWKITENLGFKSPLHRGSMGVG